MSTAFDVGKRLIELDIYIEAIQQGRKAISNWNEEFGEGNIHASALSSLEEELQDEYGMLEQKLKFINVD